MIVAPVLYMVKEGMDPALEAFVENGGTLVTTYMSGIVGQSDNVYLGGYPGPLRRLTGVWVEEIQPVRSRNHRFHARAGGSQVQNAGKPALLHPSADIVCLSLSILGYLLGAGIRKRSLR